MAMPLPRLSTPALLVMFALAGTGSLAHGTERAPATPATPTAILQALEKKQWGLAEELLNSDAVCPAALAYCQAWRLEGITLLHQINRKPGARNDPQLNKLLNLLRTMESSTALILAQHHLALAEQHLYHHASTLAEEHLHLAIKALSSASAPTDQITYYLDSEAARMVAAQGATPDKKSLTPLLERMDLSVTTLHPPERQAAALLQLARLHGLAGNGAKERHHTKQALDLLMHASGPVHALRVEALVAMAGIHQQQGELAQALENLKKAQAIHENLWGVNHPGLLSMLTRQAQLLTALNTPKAAVPLLRHALEIQRATFGPESLESAATLVALGENLLHQGQSEAARQELLLALPLLHEQEAAHPLEVRALTGLGRALLALELPDQAERHLRRALGLLDAPPGELSSPRQSLLEQHGHAVAAMERQEKFDPTVWQEDDSKSALSAQLLEVQTRLVALGSDLAMDGKPGPKSLAALRAYRSGLGLSTPSQITSQLLRETGQHLPPVAHAGE